MYAKIENSLIQVYSSLPSKYVSNNLNVIGGFDKLPDEVHRQEGFYPLVTPAITETQKLGDLYFDEENEQFTYNVIDLSAYEIAMKGWGRPEYAIKITAPAGLIDQYPAIAIWMQINNLPIDLAPDGENIILYMNVIKQQHQALFDSLILDGIITREDRPEEI